MGTRNQTNAEFRNEVHEILGRHDSSINEEPIEETLESLADQQRQKELSKISFHAIVGIAHPQTIRLQGRMKGKEVTVLVDDGSTHNFVEQSLVKKCGLTVTNDHTFQVMVANKEKMDCVGRCLALSLKIHGYKMQVDFYVLPVAACQLVLGVQWLTTSRPIETDYKKLTMTFQEGGTIHTLQGIGFLLKSPSAVLGYLKLII
ncbi:hypothetical protein ACOSQ4_010045 [Xanthoceras sorbifolium]